MRLCFGEYARPLLRSQRNSLYKSRSTVGNDEFQALNGYSYVHNSPLSFIDSTGFSPESSGENWSNATYVDFSDEEGETFGGGQMDTGGQISVASLAAAQNAALDQFRQLSSVTMPGPLLLAPQSRVRLWAGYATTIT